MKIKKEDLLGSYNLKVDIKKSEPACMECLPPTPLKNHRSLNGIPFHTRIDCPPHTVYMVDTNKFSLSLGVKGEY